MRGLSALSPLPADLSAVALAKAEASAKAGQHLLFEEWGYAEEAWYLERRMGSGGVMRALFIESPAVVEVGRYDRLLSERTLDPPADQYTLYLSDEGYRRLRRHLEATIADPTPIHATSQAKFYRAKEPYYWTHHCHHYAAHALRAAGLPISSFWALTRDMLASQLERAVQMAAESDNKPPDEPR